MQCLTAAAWRLFRCAHSTTCAAVHLRTDAVANQIDKGAMVHTREIAADVGWLVLIVLLMPLAIPFLALAFVYLLGQRLYAGHRERRRLGFAW